jgi:hypothetical protein
MVKFVCKCGYRAIPGKYSYGAEYGAVGTALSALK